MGIGACLAALLAPASACARSPVVRDGAARFEVLTPSLIRMEYAGDGAFQDSPTMTATRARLPVPAYSSRVRNGWRIIRTGRLTLRWKRGAGPFGAGNLRLTLPGGAGAAPTPAGNGKALGGWTRALDTLSARVALHPGVLSRNGWYVLDDTQTVLLRPQPPGFAVRPAHGGAYQDWYLFAYGRDYARGLRDLRALTGPAPLLGRGAFGVWFSKYFPFTAEELKGLVGDFRAHQVPLDTLSVDTDYKRVANAAGAAVAAGVVGTPGRAYSWNGWDWNTDEFPDPRGFVDWAHGQGLSLALNIHPSINSTDPHFAQAEATAGPLATDDGLCLLLQADPAGKCHVFDWTKQSNVDAYFALHRPFTDAGADLFWLDWCCEAPNSAVAPGLSADTWINRLYAQRQRARGLRWPAFSRIGASYGTDGPDGDRGAGAGGTGALAEHRSTIQFTGDTCASWEMLAFEAELTASEGSIGLPYVSHDIGSFNGEPVQGTCGNLAFTSVNNVPDDMYVRWVQFGTFQPLDRLHSNHGRRLPWEYPAAAASAAADFLRLREALVPYTYTLARRSHDTGLPMAGALYLTWPGRAAAYRHPSEYTFGRDVVVAPVTAPGDPARVTLWVPPGTWFDRFTGQRFTGPAERTLSVPLSRMPVLVRAGAVIPTQPPADHATTGPSPRQIVTAYPGARGAFDLYDDAGSGFGYERTEFTRTRLAQARRGGRTTLTIGPARGRFPGAPATRSWDLRLLGIARRPRAVTVNGRRATAAYDATSRTLTLSLSGRRTSRALRVVVR